jgi:hypothetical protein
VVKFTHWPLCHRANNTIPIEQEGGSQSGHFGECKKSLSLAANPTLRYHTLKKTPPAHTYGHSTRISRAHSRAVTLAAPSAAPQMKVRRSFLVLVHADIYIAQLTRSAHEGVHRQAGVQKSAGLWKKPWLEAENYFCGFTTTALNNLTSACKIPKEGISDFEEADI